MTWFTGEAVSGNGMWRGRFVPPWDWRRGVRLREPRRLPVILSGQEVARLLDAAPGPKYKAALSVAYGAGLRAGEVVSLKVADIDSTRMVGGIAPDGTRWVSCRPGFFLPVRVLSRLFRRLFLERLTAAHQADRLTFFGKHQCLVDAKAFARHLAPLRKIEWVVYAKRPFAGPEAVLAYLSRYTHRVAISNRRLIALDDKGVTFRWKDYRAKGPDRQKVMTLTTGEFIRRFLLHVLPGGFHRIRHYGLFANAARTRNIARARELLSVPATSDERGDIVADHASEPRALAQPCPSCGGRMIVIESFEPGHLPRAPPIARARIARS